MPTEQKNLIQNPKILLNLSMHDIFLSYSKEDKSIAKEIALGLENEGFKVWWDVDIPTGQTWDSVIENAIENCKCVVVLWSKTSVDSEWVRIEAAEGKSKNILIPVRIEEVEPPLAFRRRQFINLITWNKKPSDSKFKKLVEDIRLTIGNENYSHAENSSTDTITKVKLFKKQFKYQWLILVVLMILAFTYFIKNHFSDSKTNSVVAQIEPIHFNVTKDTLTLVFHSHTLRQVDTFNIDHTVSIKFLKDAIERHYKFSIPAKYADEIKKGEKVNPFLVVDHRTLIDEDMSLKKAGLKDFDIVEFDYIVVIE